MISSNQTNVPSKTEIINLFKTSPDLQSEFNLLVAEVIQDELNKTYEIIKKGTSPSLISLYAKARNMYPEAEFSKWSFKDEKGLIYGFPALVEIDVIKNNNNTFLCEINLDVDTIHVSVLVKIGRVYKSLNPQTKLSCLIFAKNISTQAHNVAKLFKIQVILVDDEKKNTLTNT